MSLPLPILLSLTSGPRRARMRLQCERRGDRYRLYAREGDERWAVLPPGTPADEEERWLTHGEAVSAAMLAGFSSREVERALTKPDRDG